MGEYTPPVARTGSGESLWCTTGSKSVNCPESGTTYPIIAEAWGINGDSPSADENVSWFECNDCEEA